MTLSSRQLLLACAVLCSCGREDPHVSIGAKDFAEQQVLAEMAAQLMVEAEMSPTVHNCGDSYRCQRMLRAGEIDVLFEYTGTGLQFVGGPPPNRGAPVKQVRELFEPLGLRWFEPLGFDNGYRVLLPAARAVALDVSSIADLERIPGGVRVACPPEFLRRSHDGLAALTRRYGLTLASEPLIVSDPLDRFQAVADGQADVAIGYATDGVIVELGLTVLSDPFGFFPPYHAAAVARVDTLERRDGLAEALAQLEGALDEQTMRQLNFAVQVEGREPQHVARRFLREKRMVSQSGDSGHNDMAVAIHRRDGLEAQSARAMRALRSVFVGRAAALATTDSPLEDVARGRARLAIVGAERFFADGAPDGHTEAVAVLGTRFVHLVARGSGEDQRPQRPFEGSLGLPEEGSGAALLAGVLVEDGEAVVRGTPQELISAVRSGQAEQAIIVSALGHEILARALAGSNLSLVGVGPWLTPARAVRYPYLRRARIPANTYPGQTEAVETLAAQVVLAAPASAYPQVTGAGGPAAALPTNSSPLTRAQVERLAEATGTLEVPDPVLPSAWTANARAHRPEQSAFPALLDTVLNLFVFAFLAWVALLLMGGRKRER